ncbi:MAG: DUF1761 domain-containing protein [Pseudomonadota bacterium]
MEGVAGSISWIAVLLGAVAAFLIGWLWYSPVLFGRQWADGVGVEMGSASEMPVGAMLSQLFGLLLLSWFVGAMASAGALTTLVIGTLGFAVLAFSGGMFRRNAAPARLTDFGYLVVSVIIMAVVQMLL